MTDHRIDLGAHVSGTDSALGAVADVVLHPVRRRLTHVVVQPHEDHAEARLVPIDHISVAEDGSMASDLSQHEFESLPLVEETDYFRIEDWPHPSEGWTVGTSDVLAMPYYALGSTTEMGIDDRGMPVLMSYDLIPAGEVELRRQSEVLDRDAQPVGRLDGFVVNDDDQVSHVVIDRGHLWKHREFTVPVGAAAQVRNDHIKLDLTLEQIEELPSVRFHRHHGGS